MARGGAGRRKPEKAQNDPNGRTQPIRPPAGCGPLLTRSNSDVDCRPPCAAGPSSSLSTHQGASATPLGQMTFGKLRRLLRGLGRALHHPGARLHRLHLAAALLDNRDFHRSVSFVAPSGVKLFNRPRNAFDEVPTANPRQRHPLAMAEPGCWWFSACLPSFFSRPLLPPNPAFVAKGAGPRDPPNISKVFRPLDL